MAKIKETKYCKSCDQTKSSNEFYVRSNGCLMAHCKECTKSERAAHYTKNIEELQQRSKIRYYDDKEKILFTMKERKERNKIFVYEYLLEHPCVDCGEDNPLVLEFDHLADKCANIAELICRPASLKILQSEMAKCEVRCRNCHMIKTRAEKDDWRYLYHMEREKENGKT